MGRSRFGAPLIRGSKALPACAGGSPALSARGSRSGCWPMPATSGPARPSFWRVIQACVPKFGERVVVCSCASGRDRRTGPSERGSPVAFILYGDWRANRKATEALDMSLSLHSLEIVGVHPVVPTEQEFRRAIAIQWGDNLSGERSRRAESEVREHFANLYLLEIEIEPTDGEINWSTITQPIEAQPQANWQVPYDESDLTTETATGRFSFTFWIGGVRYRRNSAIGCYLMLLRFLHTCRGSCTKFRDRKATRPRPGKRLRKASPVGWGFAPALLPLPSPLGFAPAYCLTLCLARDSKPTVE